MGKEFWGAVGRAVVDENGFPLDAGKRNSQLFEQGLDIAGLIQCRNDNAQLQRSL